MYLQNGKKINISIKKDRQGQVFLIGIDSFIKGFELQYNTIIPNDVKRAIQLYFGSAEDIPEIIKKYSSSKNKDLELRKHRLVADTLREYDPKLSEELLSLFKDNIKGPDIYYSKVNGGSTIQLPFGFVQWHSHKKTILGQLQFHHDYEKIMKLNSMQ